jgi:uncharacterized protein (TIGR04255 family)
MATEPCPLTGPIPADISLKNSPLTRVLAQVRFATVLSIGQAEKAAEFQEKIRSDYPILEQEIAHEVAFGSNPSEAPAFKQSIIWRFIDHDRKWRVSLGTGFIALETKEYAGRKDFLDRLEKILTALQETFKPSETSRIGIRYINRIRAEGFEKVAPMIKSEILGVSSTENIMGKNAKHVFTDALFVAKEGDIQTKWGLLPANASHDPDALEPVDYPSWILDLDMYSNKPISFDSVKITKQSTEFSERIWAVFNWMVNKDFLKFHGGEI